MFSSCTHNFANSLNPAELGQDNRHIWAACQRCRQPGFECYSQLLFRFLLQGILCHGLECLLHINSLLGRCFEIGNVAFRLAPGHCTLLGHLHGQLKKQTPRHEATIRTWRLPSSTSILFPNTTKGKFSGSWGLAWIRNSSRQLSRVSKDLALLTSYTRTQQSAPR